METIECSHCGEAVSSTAQLCTSCGYFLDPPDPVERAPEAVLPPAESLRERAKKDPFWLLMAAIPFAVGSLCVLTAVIAVLLAVLEPQEPLDPDCTMNGYGEGQCVFTNTTKRTARACGRIRANCSTTGSRLRSSALFCSGDVAPGESRTRSFTVPGFDYNVPVVGDWRDSCWFYWVEDE